MEAMTVALHSPGKKPVRWIAPTGDGTAHAYPRAQHGDAACGALRIDERFGYGIARHCERCIQILEGDR